MPPAPIALQPAIAGPALPTALGVAGAVLGGLVVLLTAVAFLRRKEWWIRIWDFPRLQLAVIGSVALGLLLLAPPFDGAARRAATAVVAIAVLYQASRIWRYTRLSPREVQRSALDDPARRLSIVIANVLEDNRDADTMLRVIRDADPDVVLCVETDAWWCERLDALRATHRHVVARPIHNTYGMMLLSRLPLEDVSVDFLVADDVPSIQATVVLGDGSRVWLNGVHPRPPAPGESEDSLQRDAELLQVGLRVKDAQRPVVVCGDLNDVAWSRTTRLFQQVSGLVDPRKGRGFYSTFHARYPGLRYPLDHVFHSADFRLVMLRTLPYVGSDHFPVHIVLSHEPQAEEEQEAPEADARHVREAVETVDEGEREAGAR